MDEAWKKELKRMMEVKEEQQRNEKYGLVGENDERKEKGDKCGMKIEKELWRMMEEVERGIIISEKE